MLERVATVSATVAARVGSAHVFAACCRYGDCDSASEMARAVAAGDWASLADGVSVLPVSNGFILQGVAGGVERAKSDQPLLVTAELPGREAIALRVSAGSAQIAPPDVRTGLRGFTRATVSWDGVAPIPAERIGGRRAVTAARNYHQLSTAAISVGIAEAALDAASGYLRERRQFGHPLADFAGLRAMLVDMDSELATASALVQQVANSAAALEAQGVPDVARATYVAGRCAVSVCIRAVQMHGGYGYVDEFVVERFMRDAISARARSGARRQAAAIAEARLGPVAAWE
jgi:alkylation response protein AidB-like acyl-CoA dehydrogenase